MKLKCTGREVDANRDLISIADDGEIAEGYDGRIDGLQRLSWMDDHEWARSKPWVAGRETGVGGHHDRPLAGLQGQGCRRGRGMSDRSRPEDIIKDMVGLCCPDSGVFELVECVGMTRLDVQVRPRAVAHEITDYLDDLVRNP